MAELTDDEVITIHVSIHDPATTSVNIRGADIPITIHKAMRRCVVNGLLFQEQNTAKSSKHSLLAKAGHKLTWVLPHGGRWGLIQDGVIEKRCVGMMRTGGTTSSVAASASALKHTSSTSSAGSMTSSYTLDSPMGSRTATTPNNKSTRRPEVYWAWQNDDLDWDKYAPEYSLMIEHAFETGESDLIVADGPWIISFDSMTQLNTDSDKIRKIKRVPPAPRTVPERSSESTSSSAAIPKDADTLSGKKRELPKKTGASVAKRGVSVAAAAPTSSPISVAKTVPKKMVIEEDSTGTSTGFKFGFGDESTDELSAAVGSGETESLAKKARRDEENFVSKWTIKPSDIVMGKRLGAGAFGEVMKGSYHGAAVAVKKMHYTERSTEEEKEKIRSSFHKETLLLCSLRHPNVVTYIGASVDDLMLVMEFCPLSLQNLLARQKGPLDFEKIIFISSGIAAGMGYLHSLKPAVIHRDLKPGNILLDSHCAAKLADFGISRTDDGESTMTKIGTPAYSAPEVLLEKIYDHKIDVYSFAIMLNEMATGLKPYSDTKGGGGGLGIKILTKVAKEHMRPTIASVEKGVPAGLVGLISDCWVQLSSQRPEFAEIHKRLQEIKPGGASSSSSSAATVLIPPT